MIHSVVFIDHHKNNCKNQERGQEPTTEYMRSNKKGGGGGCCWVAVLVCDRSLSGDDGAEQDDEYSDKESVESLRICLRRIESSRVESICCERGREVGNYQGINNNNNNNNDDPVVSEVESIGINYRICFPWIVSLLSHLISTSSVTSPSLFVRSWEVCMLLPLSIPYGRRRKYYYKYCILVPFHSIHVVGMGVKWR